MSYKSVEKEKEYQREYHRKPEVREKYNEYHREYRKRPEAKEKDREYRRERSKRPDVKARRNAYNKAHPEIITRQRITTYKNFLEKHGFKVIKMEDEA